MTTHIGTVTLQALCALVTTSYAHTETNDRSQPVVRPYGSWKSPITSDSIVEETIGIGMVFADGRDIYWSESRPQEKGRTIIVRRTPDGQTHDVTPPPYNARSRVHEYGGGEFTVHDGRIFFVNYEDQRIYKQRFGENPEPITPQSKMRYADLIVLSGGERLLAVREDHSAQGAEAINTLVMIDPAAMDVGKVIAAGNDFYSDPRASPDGSRLAWLAWNHPNMPWDRTELWVADLNADGELSHAGLAAGSPHESIQQPRWSPDGVLHFVSDRSGWWNLYRWTDGEIQALCPRQAEFGRPQWLFGLSTYGFESPTSIICTYTERGDWCLARLDIAARELKGIKTPYTDIRRVYAGRDAVLLVGGSPTRQGELAGLDFATGSIEVLRQSSTLAIDEAHLSVPQVFEFPTENGLTAHAYYYRPGNADYTGPSHEKPPLIVMSHGGPTGATTSSLTPHKQFWTSRGVAVLDVNYGGSTGYGREYRERLCGQWGVVDVDDCINGAKYLIAKGMVDPERIAIMGGSAGGYTTLCALTFRDFFKAGASMYGVSDLEALARDTHKFESRYLDNLVGPYPGQADLYKQRSPIHHLDQLASPVIFLQGLEDAVVPPNQAKTMVEALREKGMPVAYLAFEGEAHGFRKAENIKRTLEAILYFLGRIFEFEPADHIAPIIIENLP